MLFSFSKRITYKHTNTYKYTWVFLRTGLKLQMYLVDAYNNFESKIKSSRLYPDSQT